MTNVAAVNQVSPTNSIASRNLDLTQLAAARGPTGPLRFARDIDVSLGNGTPGKLRLLRDSDSPPRMFLIGADRKATPYDVTGKSDDEIRRGVANGNYGRLKLLAPRPTEIPPVGANQAGAVQSAKVGAVVPPPTRTQAELVRGLDNYVSKATGGEVKTMLALRDNPRYAIIDGAGNAVPGNASLWRNIQNEAYKASNGEYGVDASGRKGRLGSVTALVPIGSQNRADWVKPLATTLLNASLGAVNSYIINRSAGMTHGEATGAIPAGFARDVVNLGLTQVPLDKISDNVWLQAATKAAVGAGLTWGTNTAAKKINPAWGVDPIFTGGGMAVSAAIPFALTAVNEIQKRGGLGGVPAADPKDWKEFLHKHAPTAGVIGGSVLTFYGLASALHSKMNGIPKTKAEWLKFGALATLVPSLQYLATNGVVNPPKDLRIIKNNPDATKGAEYNVKSLLINLADLAKSGWGDPVLRAADPIEILTRLTDDLRGQISVHGTGKRPPESTGMYNKQERDHLGQVLNNARLAFGAVLRASPSENKLVRSGQALLNASSALGNILLIPTDLLRTEFQKKLGDPTRAERAVQAIERFKKAIGLP
jgi:hypothetical protein